MALKYIPVLGILLAAVVLVALVLVQPTVEAAITYNQPTLVDTFTNHTFFVATTTTATSTNDSRVPSNQVLRIDGADQVTLYLTHGGTATTSTGGARFSVQVSPDGSNWYSFNKLVGPDVSSTGTSTVTILGATTTVVASMNLTNDTFHFLRCISSEVNAPLGIDGEQTCSASVEY